MSGGKFICEPIVADDEATHLSKLCEVIGKSFLVDVPAQVADICSRHEGLDEASNIESHERAPTRETMH